MRVPKVLLALAALGAMMAGIAATAGPAQAIDSPYTIEIADRDGDITLGVVKTAVERTVGERLGAPERAVVATNTGRELTPSQIETLLNGQDAGDVRLLRSVDLPSLDTTLGDLNEGTDAMAKQTTIKVGRWRINIKISCRWFPPGCTITIKIYKV